MLSAIDSLKGPALVIETSGGRVTRYAHNMERALHLPSQSIALLTALMLRGPQTAGELRTSSERLHRFADISAVEDFLQELAKRPDDAMVVELPRQPGSRENRWAHLLSGAPAIEQTPAAASSATVSAADVTVGEIAALKAKTGGRGRRAESHGEHGFVKNSACRADKGMAGRFWPKQSTNWVRQADRKCGKKQDLVSFPVLVRAPPVN